MVTAIVSSTLTTISVFLPIAFVGVTDRADLIGRLFSLLASLWSYLLCSNAGRIKFGMKGLNYDNFKRRWTAINPSKQTGALGGVKRLFWLLWGYRLLLHLSLNLLSVLFVYQSWRLSGFGLPSVNKIIPQFGTLLWFCRTVWGCIQPNRSPLSIMAPSILKRPSTVIGVVGLNIIASGWIGSSLGATLLPELKQGRFAVDIELPIGTLITDICSIEVH